MKHTTASPTAPVVPPATITWEQHGRTEHAQWWSANDRTAPKRVVPVDDRLTADQAIRYAAQGVAMLWLGDFQNAKQLLAAMDRRVSHPKRGRSAAPNAKRGAGVHAAEELSGAEQFYRLRQTRAARSRTLSLVLVPLEGATAEATQSPGGEAKIEAVLPLPRAPRVAEAIPFAYRTQSALGLGERAVVSLQELTGVLSAHQWYLSGVEVPSAGIRIHSHYGTFLPTRHEYVDLVARAPLGEVERAFDIGVGTGVLSAVLHQRGVRHVVGTDIHERAVACATENYERLGISATVIAQLGSMFPDGRADLIVCNPPWLPGSAATTLDAAVYDPGSAMLLQFLAGLSDHLTPEGEGWLVISDLAELLGLRTRDMLLEAISQAGLTVVDRLDTAPTHSRSRDTTDVLHAARSRETTSLWRLRPAA